MGGWMDYARMRRRNGTTPRPALDRHPYLGEELAPDKRVIAGDMNRMERDYLAPVYPGPGQAQREPGSDPATVCAAATGVPVETVRTVLRHVFSHGLEDHLYDGP